MEEHSHVDKFLDIVALYIFRHSLFNLYWALELLLFPLPGRCGEEERLRQRETAREWDGCGVRMSTPTWESGTNTPTPPRSKAYTELTSVFLKP